MRLWQCLTVLFAIGCNETPPVESTVPACITQSAGSVDSADSVSASPKPAAAVTFYGDLLPILASVKTDEVYKCTTCHAHYLKPAGMNNVRELERVVESMRLGRMPRVGNAVPADKIDLFTTWRLQGFQEGSIRKSPEPTNGLDASPKEVKATPSCAG